MTNKKWIKNFFLNIIILIFIIEISYHLKSSNRHYVDYIINNILPNTKNKNVDILILGDSVAANAFKNKILKENIFDLSSNQAISMAGNYFLLKRFLEQNNPPKELFLFTIPQFYQNDLNQIWTYLYFETVFQNDEEFEEIKKIKPNLYLSENKLDKYLESRKNKYFIKLSFFLGILFLIHIQSILFLLFYLVLILENYKSNTKQTLFGIILFVFISSILLIPVFQGKHNFLAILNDNAYCTSSN